MHSSAAFFHFVLFSHSPFVDFGDWRLEAALTTNLKIQDLQSYSNPDAQTLFKCVVILQCVAIYIMSVNENKTVLVNENKTVMKKKL